MRFANLLICLMLTLCLVACGGGGGSTLAVVPIALVSLEIRPANPSIPLGISGQFTATGTYNDVSTRDLTAEVTWGSSDPSVATISNTAGSNGKVATIGAGSSVITASLGGVSASTTLTVTAATLLSINITPASPSTPLGTPVQFSATGSYSDSSINDITATATWISSALSVAKVSNTGLATPATAGTTTISAKSGTVSSSTSLTVTSALPAINVMTVSVNGSLCSANSYPNKPCVSVTICSPGTSACQTIDDILLDTGSYGLRLFKQVVTVPFTQTTVGGKPLAECVQFADGSADWGPVNLADVVLGGEPVVTVPIQIIDATFGTVPASCGTPDPSPSVAGFNGILGVGLFSEDCGLFCVSGANNGIYYTCSSASSGASCSGSTVPLAAQVQNPVALLPLDNNGVILQLPSAQAGGSASVTGQLLLGINTRSNNIPSVVTSYPADSTGSFTAIYNGTPDSNSFIDSGSNGLFFNSFGTIPECTGIFAGSGWFCPGSTLSLTAINRGSGGSPSGSVAFQIGPASTLFSTFNNVFAELGGANISSFDWGLPFFLGRSVYVGISGRSGGNLGSGPYWAY